MIWPAYRNQHFVFGVYLSTVILLAWASEHPAFCSPEHSCMPFSDQTIWGGVGAGGQGDRRFWLLFIKLTERIQALLWWDTATPPGSQPHPSPSSLKLESSFGQNHPLGVGACTEALGAARSMIRAGAGHQGKIIRWTFLPVR